jgi:hypothetical protein
MLKYCGCVEDKKEIEELQVQFLDLCKDGLLELIQPLLEKANEFQLEVLKARNKSGKNALHLVISC